MSTIITSTKKLIPDYKLHYTLGRMPHQLFISHLFFDHKDHSRQTCQITRWYLWNIQDVDLGSTFASLSLKCTTLQTVWQFRHVFTMLVINMQQGPQVSRTRLITDIPIIKLSVTALHKSVSKSYLCLWDPFLEILPMVICPIFNQHQD